MMIDGLLGVVIGFILAATWDLWKADDAASTEMERAARSVGQEIDFNRKIIDSNSDLLGQDDDVADRGLEIVTPPIELLVTGAGDYAFLRGSFGKTSAELSERLRNTYVRAATVNRRIEGRELYRATSGAMSNYHTRRKMLNSQIRRDLDDLRGRFAELLSEINKVY